MNYVSRLCERCPQVVFLELNVQVICIRSYEVFILTLSTINGTCIKRSLSIEHLKAFTYQNPPIYIWNDHRRPTQPVSVTDVSNFMVLNVLYVPFASSVALYH